MFIQEGDQYTCEPAPSCNRCSASKAEFLSTSLFNSKSSAPKKVAVTAAASGVNLHVRGAHLGGKVVDWAEDGSATVPGPNAAHYEHARKSCFLRAS